jgi:hypothetical protein
MRPLLRPGAPIALKKLFVIGRVPNPYKSYFLPFFIKSLDSPRNTISMMRLDPLSFTKQRPFTGPSSYGKLSHTQYFQLLPKVLSVQLTGRVLISVREKLSRLVSQTKEKQI